MKVMVRRNMINTRHNHTETKTEQDNVKLTKYKNKPSLSFNTNLLIPRTFLPSYLKEGT